MPHIMSLWAVSALLQVMACRQIGAKQAITWTNAGLHSIAPFINKNAFEK